MIFGFLLAVCFDPFIWQWSTQPRWCLLVVALPILCACLPQERITAVHILGAAFIFYSLLSLLWTPNIWDGGSAMMRLAVAAMAFIYGARSESIEGIFKGLSIGLWASVVCLFVQIPRTPDMIATLYPHALFGNQNMLCEIGALTALGLICYRRWWYLPAPLICLLWFQPYQGLWPSRGALLAFACGLAALVWQRSRAFGAIAVLSVALVLSIALNFGFHVSSVNERFAIWRGTIGDLNFLGHGAGSYISLSPYFIEAIDATTQRVEQAHNEVLQITYELGVMGGGLYLAILALALWFGDRRLLPALVGFLTISLVAFPWSIPANAFVGALALGHAVRFGPSLRRVLDDCRGLLRAGLYTRLASNRAYFRRAENRWEV